MCNILWLKAINEYTARQTRTRLCKHDVIKVHSIEYLTTHIELVLPTFNSLTVHKIIEYLTLQLLSSLWNIYHSRLTTAYFFDPPCMLHKYAKRGILPSDFATSGQKNNKKKKKESINRKQTGRCC